MTFSWIEFQLFFQQFQWILDQIWIKKLIQDFLFFFPNFNFTSKKKDLPVVVKLECWRKRKTLLPVQCSCRLSFYAQCISAGKWTVWAWLKEAALKKESFLVFLSPICTSFCWTFTVTVSINTFLHLHPFICLGSNGNKCVGGINRCIFLKRTNEQFVPNGLHKSVELELMLSCQSWINAVCSHIYRTLRLISSVFQNFHTLEEHFWITVTPKRHLDAEMGESPSASVFKLRMRNMLRDLMLCTVPVCILMLAVINEWYKSLNSFKAATFNHYMKSPQWHVWNHPWPQMSDLSCCEIVIV